MRRMMWLVSYMVGHDVDPEDGWESGLYVEAMNEQDAELKARQLMKEEITINRIERWEQLKPRRRQCAR